MKDKKNILRNLIVFILLIILTFYILLKDQNFNELYLVLMSVKKQYILIAILAMCIYVTCESINTRRVLKALDENISFFKSIKYTLIGFFFSSITPAASGGQPMQIYYMCKEGISVSHSTLALLIQLSTFQIATISFALISLFFNYRLLDGALIGLFILGITLNSTALILLLIGICSKKLSMGLINVAVKLLKLLKVKNLEDKKAKLEEEVKKYQDSADYIKSHKFVILKNLLTTCVQVIAFYSVTYWVYCSFGLNAESMFRVITIQALLYATVSGIPSPGAVGVTEGGFVKIFKSVFPLETISSAMILSRGVSFYLLVIVCGITVSISSLKLKKIEKKQGVEES